MTFAIALGSAILSGISIVMHIVAPRTSTTKDDKILALIDLAISKLQVK